MSPIRQQNIVGRWCPSAGATGFRLQDFSGRGNHGTLTDMDPATDWVVSGGKRALYFDGTGNCVLIPQAGEFSSTYTISMWMRRGSITSYRNILTRGSGAVDDLELYFTATTLVIVHNRANGGNLTNAQYPAPTVSQWVHVCLTYDSGLAATVDRWKLYFDGVLQTASANSGTFSPPNQTQGQIQIGRSEASAVFGATRYYLGDLDDVTIFNVTLPPAEVYELRRRGRGYGVGHAGPLRRSVRLATSGDTSVTLQDAALAWASDTLTLEQDQVLSPQAADLALTADALTLTQDQTLAPQDAALSLTGEAVTLMQDHAVSAQDASLALDADAVTLDAAGNDNVSAQGADLAFTTEALTLVQDHLAAIQDAGFALDADAATLTQDHLLAIQDAVLSWAAGAVTVSSGGSGASAADIWNYEIAPGFTAERLLRIVAAAVAGKVSGAPATPVFRDVGDTQDMITGEADSSGNRTDATYGP